MAFALPAWMYDFERGASFHGNWPACVEAESVQERFIGGQPCPHRCGSIIRYRVGRPREESVRGHAQDPRACRKHPKYWEVRRSDRAEATSAQVSAPALSDRAGRAVVRAERAGRARPHGVPVLRPRSTDVPPAAEASREDA